METEYLFKTVDRYDTPAGRKPTLGFRCFGRGYFYLGNFGVFCRSGNAGEHGRLDQAAQIYYSNMNLRLVERCGGRVHLRGLDHLRALNGRPVVLIGNHMSLLETALLHAVAREYVDFSFIVKESLMHIPYFRGIMLALNAIPVTRTNPREDLKTVLTRGREVLESGRSMIVFPQSTRSESVDPEKFNSIGVKLARSAGVPVLPFALKTDFLGNGRWLRDLGPVRPERDIWFEFGEPMTVEGNGQEQMHRIVDFIVGRVAEWRRAETAGQG